MKKTKKSKPQIKPPSKRSLLKEVQDEKSRRESEAQQKFHDKNYATKRPVGRPLSSSAETNIKKQYGFLLPLEVKHALDLEAINTNQSLSGLVEKVLRAHLGTV